jgi:hypothetical protein
VPSCWQSNVLRVIMLGNLIAVPLSGSAAKDGPLCSTSPSHLQPPSVPLSHHDERVVVLARKEHPYRLCTGPASRGLTILCPIRRKQLVCASRVSKVKHLNRGAHDCRSHSELWLSCTHCVLRCCCNCRTFALKLVATPRCCLYFTQCGRRARWCYNSPAKNKPAHAHASSCAQMVMPICDTFFTARMLSNIATSCAAVGAVQSAAELANAIFVAACPACFHAHSCKRNFCPLLRAATSMAFNPLPTCGPCGHTSRQLILQQEGTLQQCRRGAPHAASALIHEHMTPAGGHSRGATAAARAPPHVPGNAMFLQ